MARLCCKRDAREALMGSRVRWTRRACPVCLPASTVTRRRSAYTISYMDLAVYPRRELELYAESTKVAVHRLANEEAEHA
eukprot:5892012-Pleurochrysis_carterae.AAC.2